MLSGAILNVFYMLGLVTTITKWHLPTAVGVGLALVVVFGLPVVNVTI